MHALIIEDEPLIAMAIEDILCDLGFTSFDLAPSPQSAIDAAAARCPDLITSDVQLKPGCGITTVMRICSGVAIPVVFITGNASDVNRRLPQHCALSKPFSDRELRQAVAVAMIEGGKPVCLPIEATASLRLRAPFSF